MGQSSANYQGHSYVTSPSSRSYGSNYHSTSMSNHQHEVSSSGRRNPSGGGLPDFNLTDEIFQHFLRSSKQVTPPPSGIPDYISPRHPSSESYSHFPMPHTSSPIKRTSSPDMGVHIPPRGDQHARSNSPDVFLPTPEHLHWQQPMSHSYTNSYHPPMPERNAHTNTPSRSNSKPTRPGMTGANPQHVSGSYWHDGMGTGYQQQHPPQVLRHHHSDVGPLREEGGAYRQGQHPPRSAGIPSPRRQKEESIDEFLQTINDSTTNPFGAGGGGTLV